MDELLPKVIEFAKIRKNISISMIQREFMIGYNRASRLLEKLNNNSLAVSSRPPNPPTCIHGKVMHQECADCGRGRFVA